MSYRQRLRRGFTLVELIVIVAILALLIAMLLPAIMKMRQFADMQEDREQLRVLGHAWLSYAQAHQGHPVPQSTSEPFDRWIKRLSGYGDISNYLVSPGDPHKKERNQFMDQNPGRYCSSFVLNPYFSTRIVDLVTNKQLSCDRVSDCTSLSTAIAVLPISPEGGVPGPGRISPQGWMTPPLSLAWQRTTGRLGIQPDRFLATSSNATPGLASYFYADGHVDSLTAEQVRTWVESGKNFLIPQQ